MKITAIRCFVAILCTLVASCAKEDPGIHHGPYVYVLEGGDVEIRWRIAEPAGSRVDYGTTRKFGSQVNRADLTLVRRMATEPLPVVCRVKWVNSEPPHPLTRHSLSCCTATVEIIQRDTKRLPIVWQN